MSFFIEKKTEMCSEQLFSGLKKTYFYFLFFTSELHFQTYFQFLRKIKKQSRKHETYKVVCYCFLSWPIFLISSFYYFTD